MRYMKIIVAALLLTAPVLAAADAESVPDSAVWYFHVDLEQMRSSGPGRGLYEWLQDEALVEVKEESGFDIDRELDSLTAFSVPEAGPVILFEGDISQETKDKVMAFIAADGDISPFKSSGKTYYKFNSTEGEGSPSYSTGDIEIDFESLAQEAWVSLALKDKLLITGSEEQMQALLKSNGKIAGKKSHPRALLVLTAEKTLLQAGMNSAVMGDEGDWDSNILRNTEQVAFLLAAAADKLAIEAQLITTEPEMAESLASVARGLISLMSFDEGMDPETTAVLQGTRIEAKGNSLNLSLAVAPELVVQTLGD